MSSHLKKIPFALSLVSLLSFGLFLRLYNVDNKFLTCETHNFLWGVRLHNLSFFNFGNWIDNFFTFLFATLGGFRYILSTFVFSQVYSWLGIPISEFWILAFHSIVGTVLIGAVACLGAVWGGPIVGLLGASLVTLNGGPVWSSRWDNGEPLVSLTVTLAVLIPSLLGPTRSVLKALMYGLVLALVASMESFMVFPLLFFYWVLAFGGSTQGLVGKLRQTLRFFLTPPGLLIVGIPLAMLAIHGLVWLKAGRTSNLGMFGLMTLNYSARLTLTTFVPRVVWVFNHYSIYFFGSVFFPATLIAAFFLFIFYRSRTPRALLCSAAGFLYFFVAFVFTPNTLIRAEHLYICEALNSVFIASVWYYFGKTLLSFSKPAFRPGVTWALSTLAVFWIFWQGKAALTSTMKEPILVHPFKSVGYFTRKFGSREDTLFSLWKCGRGECYNHFLEYYTGKQIIDLGEPKLYPRQLFCVGSAPIPVLLDHYGLKDFSFYLRLVKIYKEFPDNRREILYEDPGDSLKIVMENGLRPVAQITYRNELLAEIYSNRAMPLVQMDMDTYDPLWETEFANLQDLLGGPRVGLVSTFGEHWSLDSGYPKAYP